jgi:U3 small nucleolar RNA-associated protein 3
MIYQNINNKRFNFKGNKLDNEEDAELEEEEAKALQAKMLKQLDTNDFGLDAFKIDEKAKLLKTEEELVAEKHASKTLGDFDQENLQKIAKNLSIMSKKEKLDFLQRESPELFELIRDFKTKVEKDRYFNMIIKNDII